MKNFLNVIRRQGIELDCSKVMELTLEGGFFKNGNNELADAETEFIFPLIKGSAIKNPVINRFSKYVLVTQKFVQKFLLRNLN